MSANSKLFIERLHALADIDTDNYLVVRLYELCDLIENDPDSSLVIPHIFAFFEAHSEADFGAPGPLVHFLEKQPDDERYLLESILRKPTGPTVRMVNSILNTNITVGKRDTLLDLLRSVQANPQNDEIARDQAEHYLTYQASRRRS